MPASERTQLVIAGAIIGVLGVLLTLFALVDKLDTRYVTSAEYRATLGSIATQLTDIKADLRTHMGKTEKP